MWSGCTDSQLKMYLCVTLWKNVNTIDSLLCKNTCVSVIVMRENISFKLAVAVTFDVLDACEILHLII